jgi:hypothetical protein
MKPFHNETPDEMPDETPECWTCNWTQDDEHKHMGQCHRRAPTVILVDPADCVDSTKIFPSTDKVEWCGEYHEGD